MTFCYCSMLSHWGGLIPSCGTCCELASPPWHIFLRVMRLQFCKAAAASVSQTQWHILTHSSHRWERSAVEACECSYAARGRCMPEIWSWGATADVMCYLWKHRHTLTGVSCASCFLQFFFCGCTVSWTFYSASCTLSLKRSGTPCF